MYFYKKNSIDLNKFNLIVDKITILQSPIEYSSTTIRNIIKKINQTKLNLTIDDNYKLEKINDYWNLIKEICGDKIVNYIKDSNLFL